MKKANPGFLFRLAILLFVMLSAGGLVTYIAAMAGTPHAEAAVPNSQSSGLSAVQRPVLPNTTDVTVFEFAFNPQNITVTTGTIVRWTNIGSVTHSSTSDTNMWDSGVLNPGQQFTFTFTTLGNVPYHCSVHPFMTATIRVVDCPPTATPTITPTPTATCPPVTVDNSIID